MIFHPVGVRMGKRLCKRHTAAVSMKKAKLQLRDCPPQFPGAQSQGKRQSLALSTQATQQTLIFHSISVRMGKRLCKRHAAAVPMEEAKLQLCDCPTHFQGAQYLGTGGNDVLLPSASQQPLLLPFLPAPPPSHHPTPLPPAGHQCRTVPRRPPCDCSDTSSASHAASTQPHQTHIHKNAYLQVVNVGLCPVCHRLIADILPVLLMLHL